MVRPKYGPDDHWEGVYDEMGWIPVSYLEKFAICLIDGGCSVRDANVIANHEEQLRATYGYAPGRHSPPMVGKMAEPSMVAYSRKLAGE